MKLPTKLRQWLETFRAYLADEEPVRLSNPNPKAGDRIYAPWDERTIEIIKEIQTGKYFHPYTCRACSCRKGLSPTANGWICEECDYRQDWYIKPPDRIKCSGFTINPHPPGPRPEPPKGQG